MPKPKEKPPVKRLNKALSWVDSQIKALTKRRNHLKKRINRATPKPLRLRAYDVAETLVGITEQGGNNTGPAVDKIIRANGGTIGEPWCGDAMAFCYRNAGSKAVQRLWASAPALGGLLGIKRIANPLKGDLVRFNFSSGGNDHVGLFEKDNGDGTITTLEGNTGDTGAVSDSRTGGDGFKRKVRSKTLVNDYLRVTR